MADNTWGFGWGATTASNDTLTYYTVPAFGTLGSNINNGKLEGATTTSVASTTKKIVFAAKFASNNANSGHYKTSILLSISAPPSIVATGFGGITNMQDMTSTICSKAFTAGSLEDTRDGSVYSVDRLDDGKCWMTSNLKLVGSRILTNGDSDVTSDYILNVSETSVTSWGKDSAEQKVYYNTAEPEYGAYYQWCSATANTCADVVANGAVASSSICPRGWRLPTQAEYSGLLSSASITANTAGYTKIQGNPYGFSLVGYVYGNSLRDIGSVGRYWSSTSSASDYAYYLDINSSYVRVSSDSRYSGCSVRCVAK